ncbi:DNA helicase, partial [Exophiala xenobiotica]
MLNRAVNRYASTAQGEKTQTPLRLNAAAANVPRESTSNGMKRKFDRSMSTASSLGSLHQQTSFDENSPPGGYVDLTSPEKRSDIRYPSLHNLD